MLVTTYVSSRGGGLGDIPPDGLPPTLNFSYYHNIIIKKTIFFFLPNMWSQKPPEAVSEAVNFKIFLGEHAPRPPYFEYVTPRYNFPPSNKKSCIKPCVCITKP